MKDTRKDEELNRIIAEWMGLKFYPEIHPEDINRHMLAFWADGEMKTKNARFCSDLNAIHEAVSKLGKDLYDDDRGFTWHLARVVHGYDAEPESVGFDFYEMQEASARQRAEALVAVIESKA